MQKPKRGTSESAEDELQKLQRFKTKMKRTMILDKGLDGGQPQQT